MKIISLTTSYPHQNNTASGIFVGQLLGALSKYIDVVVLVPTYSGNKNFIKMGRESIHAFRYATARHEVLAHSPGGLPVAIRKRPVGGRIALCSMMFSMFLNLLRHVVSGVDIIHANWSFSGFLALPFILLGKKLIVTLRGDDVSRAMNSKWNYVLLGVLIKFSDHIITVSKDMQIWLEANYPYKNKISYIGNGVSEVFFNIGETRDYRRQRAIVRFVCVGNLIPRKNIQFILHSLANLSVSTPWSLTIIGDGPQRNMLEALTQDIDLSHKVEFLGALDNHSIARIFFESDILLFSSLSEGKPNVVMEAMAAGLLVIAPQIPGINELFWHQDSGVLYESNNDEEFVRILGDVCSDFGRYVNHAINGNNVAKTEIGRWDNTAEKYLKTFHAVSS